jgi:dihydrolipoamide dehydrogenase
MASKEHDLVVIGAGPGGYVAAIRAAQLGLNVACIDREPVLGGTCLRIGCIPSKALLESSERYWFVRQEAEEHGIAIKDSAFDVGRLMARKERIVGELTKGVAGLFKKNGITAYQGTGKLNGPGEVSVAGGEEVTLRAKHVIIATGSIPASLPGIEIDHEYIGYSSMGLSLTEVPERLVVIGAGYIGLELGSVWHRLGSQVTFLEYLDRILPGIDSELAREALRSFKKQKLEFKLKSKVTAATVKGKGKQKHVVIEVEGEERIECDRALLAVGRKPYTEGLGLEEAGVELDDKGRIKVDENFQTGVKGVYAIGDVIEGPMLAHKASHEGIACVEKIVTGYGEVNYAAIPAVVYTEPEIAGVGQTEDELKEAGAEYNKGVFLFRANGRAKALGQIDGRVKVLSDKETDRLLGVQIIGPRAGELIAECTIAMEFGATSEDIARTCHAHPTLSEVVMEAASACFDKPIHS